MVNRWATALQELDYTTEYVKGEHNSIADALSRLCPNLKELVVPVLPLEISVENTISALHEISPITPLQLEAIQMCHNSMVGHGGVDRTILKLLSLEEQWIDMSKHVKVRILPDADGSSYSNCRL